MWPKRAHVLAPLTDAVETCRDKNKRIKFKWTPKMDQTFKEVKSLLATDAITYYPDHNKPFHILFPHGGANCLSKARSCLTKGTLQLHDRTVPTKQNHVPH